MGGRNEAKKRSTVQPALATNRAIQHRLTPATDLDLMTTLHWRTVRLGIPRFGIRTLRFSPLMAPGLEQGNR
jgi:hypothetical protein